MNKVPQIATVAELRHSHLQVFTKLHQGPVIIAQHSKPAAVLVSVEQWDAIAQRLERFELVAKARQIDTEMERDPAREITLDELKQRLKHKAII